MKIKFLVIFICSGGLFLQAVSQSDSSRKSTHVVFPILARSIETGWDVGLVASITLKPHKLDTISRTSSAQILALYSQYKQFVAAINGTQYFKNEKYILAEQISFSSFYDKFWGMGNHSLDKNEESYTYKQYYTYLHLMRKIAPNFFVGGLFEFQQLWNINYLKGGLFDQESIIGRNGYKVAGMGASVTFDSRNNAFSSNKGLYAQLYFNHFNSIIGSDENFTSVVLDCRKYIPITKNNVLALQLYSFNNIGTNIPLRSMASLGGANRMRGYYEGRYSDKQCFTFQAETRFPVYKRFSMVTFGGMGAVANQLRQYSLNDLKLSYGIGARYAINKTEKLNIRVDYGIGNENTRGFYLQIGEAF